MESALTRRQLIGSGAAAGALLAAGPLLDPPAALARALPRRRRSRHPSLPSAERLRRQVEQMVELGPRLPGTRPHREFVDSVDERLRRAGITVERDRHRFTRWSTREFSLDLLGGAAAERVPVANYYTYSGRTTAQGVETELAYAGALPALSVAGEPTNTGTRSRRSSSTSTTRPAS